MRFIFLIQLFVMLIFLLPGSPQQSFASTVPIQKEVSLIFEVTGSPEQAAEKIKKDNPFIEIAATYTILLQAVAIKGTPRHVEKAITSDVVQSVYPVQAYTTLMTEQEIAAAQKKGNLSFPADFNKTSYTGKGIKVAVIDTGIAMDHPDLQNQIFGGYDLVDLDDDPAETTVDEGPPTYHGTHVGGIIAGNGTFQGVAPDSELYIYRALGPGGTGTSIQVIAAMEEAVQDGVDVMNLSLGNTVNGPDYPTSKAVDQAAEKGVAVIVANGNDGPEKWTVGAPATAKSALSVGAYQQEMTQAFLLDPPSQKKIALKPLLATQPWELTRDYKLTTKPTESRGKIGLVELKRGALEQTLKAFQDAGAVGVIMDVSEVKQNEMLALMNRKWDIPFAQIRPEDHQWLQEKQTTSSTGFYLKQGREKIPPDVASFSSSGPVAMNWMMKPDLLAPGVQIVSTVPEGYDVLNGTSMAAPHIAGAVAVLKEAHPDWTNAQIFGALKTTATVLEDLEPIVQGAGEVQLDKAVTTNFIIDNPLLSFGKMGAQRKARMVEITIENISGESIDFHFDMPKQQKGINWRLPQAFQLRPGEKKAVPIEMSVNPLQEKSPIVQGFLTLNVGNEKQHLPYTVVQESADYPRISGFTFALNPLDDAYYEYELYAAEKPEMVELHLYDPDTLAYEGKLASWTELEVGQNEGRLKRKDTQQKGLFYGLLLVKNEQGAYFTYETEVYLM